MLAKKKPAKRPPLNFNDPTLAATEMETRTDAWNLSVENFPSLARFRFPGIIKVPSKEPPSQRATIAAVRAQIKRKRRTHG